MVRSQEDAGWTIAGLARTGGVGIETVRYYQRRGLLETPARGEGPRGVRRYGERDLQRLGFIRSAQAAGFTLDGIAELIALDATSDRARARQLASERIEALDARIAELKAARDVLSRLARACGGGSSGPCPIITTFAEGEPRPARGR